jgi:hypothetical protein
MSKTTTTVATLHPPSPFPSSQKKYIIGSRDDLRVPVREILLSATHHADRVEESPPLPVYDCSGPPTNPSVEIDLARGLPALRAPRVEERDDTERLTALSSAYGRQRQSDLLTHDLRFPAKSTPRRARDGRNVDQLHYGYFCPTPRLNVITDCRRIPLCKLSTLIPAASQGAISPQQRIAERGAFLLPRGEKLLFHPLQLYREPQRTMVSIECLGIYHGRSS